MVRCTCGHYADCCAASQEAMLNKASNVPPARAKEAGDAPDHTTMRSPMARALALIPDLLNYSVTVTLVRSPHVSVCVQWGDPCKRGCEIIHSAVDENAAWLSVLAWAEQKFGGSPDA